MFNTTQYDSQTDRYYVSYNGSDDKDILGFYNTIYRYDASNRSFYNYGYWVSKEVYDALLLQKANLKLTPYSYQEEAANFAINKKSSLMLLPCGAGN